MPESQTPDFDVIFREHLGFVCRVLRRHAVPESHLEDACQEVFIVVHRRLSDFEGRSSLKTWLYGIALRVASATRNKAALRRETLTEELPLIPFEIDPTERLQQQEQLAWIQEALAQLKGREREVFVLYEIEGMSMAEVAQSLSLPENTALYRLYAAQAAIRRWVARKEIATVSREGGGVETRPIAVDRKVHER